VAAAQNIGRQIAGQDPAPFHYRDPGTLVVIGRNAGAVHLRGRAFTGFPAWVLWLGVHLVKLIGFRNRLLVLINWAWNYFFYEHAVRLILPSANVPASGSRQSVIGRDASREGVAPKEEQDH
jgi:NADH dehydrogenase